MIALEKKIIRQLIIIRFMIFTVLSTCVYLSVFFSVYFQLESLMKWETKGSGKVLPLALCATILSYDYAS